MKGKTEIDGKIVDYDVINMDEFKKDCKTDTELVKKFLAKFGARSVDGIAGGLGMTSIKVMHCLFELDGEVMSEWKTVHLRYFKIKGEEKVEATY